MKIPFSIKFKPQIESGEYKVCIDYDWPVEILSWDCIHVNSRGKHFPILAKITCLNPGEEHDFIHWYNNEGKYDPWDGISSAIQDNDCIAYCPGHDLFLITPEPELSEFEEHLKQLLDFSVTLSSPYEIDCIKTEAAELLALARKELCEQIVNHTKEAYENGKAEALKDLPRWSPNDIYPELNDVVIGSIGTDEHYFIHRGKIIHLESLEKLPGFNE